MITRTMESAKLYWVVAGCWSLQVLIILFNHVIPIVDSFFSSSFFLQRQDFPNGFHVAYRVHFNDRSCTSGKNSNSTSRAKEMIFTITEGVRFLIYYYWSFIWCFWFWNFIFFFLSFNLAKLSKKDFQVVIFAYTLAILLCFGLVSAILCSLAIKSSVRLSTSPRTSGNIG